MTFLFIDNSDFFSQGNIFSPHKGKQNPVPNFKVTKYKNSNLYSETNVMFPNIFLDIIGILCIIYLKKQRIFFFSSIPHTASLPKK